MDILQDKVIEIEVIESYGSFSSLLPRYGCVESTCVEIRYYFLPVITELRT